MAVSYQLLRAPFSEPLIGEIHGLAEKVFGTGIDDGGAWRFENMPDFQARVGEQLVGFKLGYAHTPTRYYSWLGGVDPEYRRQGIAGGLMHRQHAWLLEAALAQSIAEIIAYKSVIENIRNWPFDNPTLTRFALYLLIPLVSWFGGAFVERGLDLFLS